MPFIAATPVLIIRASSIFVLLLLVNYSATLIVARGRRRCLLCLCASRWLIIFKIRINTNMRTEELITNSIEMQFFWIKIIKIKIK